MVSTVTMSVSTKAVNTACPATAISPRAEVFRKGLPGSAEHILCVHRRLGA